MRLPWGRSAGHLESCGASPAFTACPEVQHWLRVALHTPAGLAELLGSLPEGGTLPQGRGKSGRRPLSRSRPTLHRRPPDAASHCPPARMQVPSYIAFQETPLQSFWPAVLFVVSIAEVFSVRPPACAAGSCIVCLSIDRRGLCGVMRDARCALCSR